MVLRFHSSEDDSLSSSTFDLEQIFIAREQQLDLFNMYLNRWQQLIYSAQPDNTLITAAPTPYTKIQSLIVLLYGRGGFGKSTLIRRYRDNVLKQNETPLFSKIKVSKIVDWEFKAMGKHSLFNLSQDQDINASEYFRLLCFHLADALDKTPQDFKDYQSALKDVEKAKKKASGVLESIKKDDSYGWLRGLTVDAVTSLVRSYIPASSIILDRPDVKLAASEVAKITQEQLEQVYTKLQNKLGSEFGDYLEAPMLLGLALGRDLQDFAKNYPLLIFFDTYEEIDEGDQLLRTIMGAAGQRVGWVLAGRDNLWAGLEQRKRSIAMEYGYKDIVLPEHGLAVDFNIGGVGEFTISDITKYFAQLRTQLRYKPPLPIVTENDASRILEVTKGVPLAVKIAAGLYKETTDLDIITKKAEGKRKIVDEMVQRYLLHTRSSQSERIKLYGLALLRIADRPPSIAAALGLTSEQAKTSYATELSRLHKRYSFIFTEKELPSLHQEVRHFLRVWLLEHRTQPEIMAMNEHLKESHLFALKNLEDRRKYVSLKKRMEDEEWVEIYLDLAEQTFWLDPSEGVDFLLPLIIVAGIYHRDLIRYTVEIGRFFEKVIPLHHQKYWELTVQTLAYKKSRTYTRTEIFGLEELARLEDQQHYPKFSLEVLSEDYQKEVEALLSWRLGEVYLESDEKKALEWYEKSLVRLSQDVELREATSRAAYSVGQSLYENKKYAECKALFDRAIELDPSVPFYYSDRGNVYNILEDYSQAIADYDQAIRFYPDHSHFYANRGRTYLKLKDYHQAISDFNKAIKLEPTSFHAYRSRGSVYAELKDYHQAITDFDQAIKLNPTYSHAYRSRGSAYVELKDYHQAITDFDQAIKLEPTSFHAYRSRGSAYAKLKDYRQAIADFDQAIKLNPTYAYCYVERGNAYLELKDYRQAIADFDQTIEMDVDFVHVGQKKKGLALYSLGEYQEAVEAFFKALLNEPACTECWVSLASTYKAFTPLNEIPKLLREVPIPTSNTLSVIICRTDAMSALGLYDEALIERSRAVDMDRQRTEVLLERAEIYIARSSYEEALADLDQAIRLDKTIKHNVLTKRGLVLSYLSRYSEAIESYKQDLHGDVNDFTSLYNIAVAMVRWKGLANSQTHIDTARSSLLNQVGSDSYGPLIYGLGGLEALAGNIDEALNCLQKAIFCTEQAIFWARHDVAWLDLRTDVRWQELALRNNYAVHTQNTTLLPDDTIN